MGWERRGHNSYYYHKYREDGRVVSEYVKSNELAQLIAAIAALVKKKKAEDRQPHTHPPGERGRGRRPTGERGRLCRPKLAAEKAEIRSGRALDLLAIGIHVNDGAFDAGLFGGEGHQVAFQ